MEEKESNKDSDTDAARDDSSSSAAAAAVSQSNVNGNYDASAASDDNDNADCAKFKCKLCKKRLGRKNCPHLACFQCCTDPACEPHREARDLLRRKESILDGTDRIGRAAAAKRASRVSPGAFFDSNIRYFGDTVVLWNFGEFAEVTKWREDAMRRSRNRREKTAGGLLELGDVVGGGRGSVAGGTGGKKRGRTRKATGCVDAAKNSGAAEKRAEVRNAKVPSRKRRFKNICDELYRKFLNEE